jgi:hypothetical protein
MSTIVSGNTASPVVMIAEKASDLIREAGRAQRARVPKRPTHWNRLVSSPALTASKGALTAARAIGGARLPHALELPTVLVENSHRATQQLR